MSTDIESSFKRKSYKTKDTIRILNPRQAAFYWGNGCEPLDIYIGKDYETMQPVIIYIFSREQTQMTGVYDEWCKRKSI